MPFDGGNDEGNGLWSIGLIEKSTDEDDGDGDKTLRFFAG